MFGREYHGVVEEKLGIMINVEELDSKLVFSVLNAAGHKELNLLDLELEELVGTLGD